LKKGGILGFVLTATVLLFGCADSFVEEARKQHEESQKQKEEEMQIEKEKEREQKEFYEDIESPVEEIVEENKIDVVAIQKPMDIVEKEQYDDPNEFSQYVSKILYEFYTLKLSPEKYYDFLIKYASEETKKQLPSAENATTVYSAIQDLFRQQSIKGEGYEISEVVFDRFKRSGYFYRKLSTTNGNEYYITTITLEKDGWKFVDDSPSPPFEEDIGETTTDTISDEDSNENTGEQANGGNMNDNDNGD